MTENNKLKDIFPSSRPLRRSDETYLHFTGIPGTLSQPTTSHQWPRTLPRIHDSYPQPDADTLPVADVVQDFKAAAIRLLERFAQDTSQAAHKRESWSRIAQLIDETEPQWTAALTDTILLFPQLVRTNLVSSHLHFNSRFPPFFLQLRSIPTHFGSVLCILTSVDFISLALSCHLHLYCPWCKLSHLQLCEKELTFSIVLLYTAKPSLYLQYVLNVLVKQLSIV